MSKHYPAKPRSGFLQPASVVRRDAAPGQSVPPPKPKVTERFERAVKRTLITNREALEELRKH